jgi:3-methyladenine DNA glycosylase AlkC
VWTKKIDELKEHPEKGIPLLDPLKSDTSKYVRDSVGNWLNDASKTRPDWVKNVCARWEKESPTKETQYILKKALRTINK